MLAQHMTDDQKVAIAAKFYPSLAEEAAKRKGKGDSGIACQ